jgi:hypothetical protein
MTAAISIGQAAPFKEKSAGIQSRRTVGESLDHPRKQVLAVRKLAQIRFLEPKAQALQIRHHRTVCPFYPRERTVSIFG